MCALNDILDINKDIQMLALGLQYKEKESYSNKININ